MLSASCILTTGGAEIATAQKPNLRIVCIRAQIKNKCTVAENRNSGKKSCNMCRNSENNEPVASRQQACLPGGALVVTLRLEEPL